MTTTCLLCALLLAISTDVVPAKQDVPTLERFRAAVARFHRDGHADPGFPIDLSGYTFHWEVDLGNGDHYVLISQNYQGQILAFSKDGLLKDSLVTTEIRGLQICDINSDLRFEIITTQVDSRGTGLLEENFHVYDVGNPFLRELWSGVAYSFLPEEKTPGRLVYREARGYLNCGGGGLQHYLVREGTNASNASELTRLVYTSAGTLEAASGNSVPQDRR